MNKEEEYFILGFLSFLLLLIIGLSFLGRRKSTLYKFTKIILLVHLFYIISHGYYLYIQPNHQLYHT